MFDDNGETSSRKCSGVKEFLSGLTCMKWISSASCTIMSCDKSSFSFSFFHSRRVFLDSHRFWMSATRFRFQLNFSCSLSRYCWHLLCPIHTQLDGVSKAEMPLALRTEVSAERTCLCWHRCQWLTACSFCRSSDQQSMTSFNSAEMKSAVWLPGAGFSQWAVTPIKACWFMDVHISVVVAWDVATLISDCTLSTCQIFSVRSV